MENKIMKPKLIAAILWGVTYVAVVTLSLSTYHASQTKRGDKTIHVLPRVEEMPTNPTPFSF